MSFWNKAKEIFTNVKCGLNFHAGDWNYLQEGLFEQELTCIHCN
jgi:hypothetical protein